MASIANCQRLPEGILKAIVLGFDVLAIPHWQTHSFPIYHAAVQKVGLRWMKWRMSWGIKPTKMDEDFMCFFFNGGPKMVGPKSPCLFQYESPLVFHDDWMIWVPPWRLRKPPFSVVQSPWMEEILKTTFDGWNMLKSEKSMGKPHFFHTGCRILATLDFWWSFRSDPHFQYPLVN